ncbi:N4-gp56 family major capsid protein [Limosilactobacillus balticus]|uniref:N4-gp56 family major capsid protein n=1 Tax=Limosilactobacillus balticus TaxID=2759747 RepID=UPI001E55E08D|nr:N4-gp56 family major capsid protein [Limosilactobacillus balticus]MCD7132962.1 N4-gp56 family major capsid protein [Limosilactobacillus balticus]
MAGEITVSGQMLDPQVLSEMLSAQLTAGLRFAPLGEIDTTLVGKPGSTVDFPAWNYIGDAKDLKEGEAIETADLTYGTKSATIKEVGNGVNLTDQSILTGYGDPYGEAGNQLLTSIQNKIDNDSLEALRGATQTKSADATLDGLQDVLDMYNLEDDRTVIAIVSPTVAGRLRLSAGKDWLRGSELGAQRIISGVSGEILAVQIVRSRKLNANEGIFVLPKKDAKDKAPLKIMLKRDVVVEAERHAGKRSTALYASTYQAPYLYDPSKVIKVTFNGVTGPEATTGAPADQSVDETVSNVKEENRLGRQSKKTSKSADDKKPGEA